MVSVHSVALAGLLNVNVKEVSVGTTTRNETEPKALERPAPVIK